MQLYPTRPAAHLAIVGVAMAAAGALAGEAAIVGFAAAVLIAVAIARAVTLVAVARIRAAGFEMLWVGSKRLVRTTRGTEHVIEAEVRNRDTLAARYVKLRALASPNLEVSLEPAAGEVRACGRLKVKVIVKAPRVGQHGLYGLALEVRGAPGMFEVPLTFANPYGVDVLPKAFVPHLRAGRGAKSHLIAPAGRAGRLRGDGSTLRELREHVPGDPFRRIAWKASAKRGRLMVREYEREEREIVWIVLDTSVELWSGPVGRAPLDAFIDEAAAVASRHLARGDRVGLVIADTAVRATVLPDTGSGQLAKLVRILATSGGTIDASRSDLDELDVAVRVIEHLRPLDDRGLADVPRNALDKLAQRADAMRARAPFRVKTPEGRSERDAMLRRYLASFGIDAPPKTQSDRKVAAEAIVSGLVAIARQKPRASLVYVFASAPDPAVHAALQSTTARLSRAGSGVYWTLPAYEAGLLPPWLTPRAPADDGEKEQDAAFSGAAPQAALAVRLRSAVASRKAEASLRKVGVRLARVRPRENENAAAALEIPGTSSEKIP